MDNASAPKILLSDSALITTPRTDTISQATSSPPGHLIRDRARFALAVAASLMCMGCPNQAAQVEVEPASSGMAEFMLPPPTRIARIEQVLDYTLHERTLDLHVHRAWQILHGTLAFQQDFYVEHDGESVQAIEHILNGGHMTGWTVEVVKRDGSDMLGLRAALEEGSKAGQGHADQWLAVLSQCHLPPDQIIRVKKDEVTMMDFVAQVQQDLPRNVKQEFSWTLIGLTAYLPTDAQWTASDGKTWSIEKLVEIEANQELASSACGGTHRMIGLATALKRHQEADGEVSGSWNLAEEAVARAIEQAKQNQNTDGSFSIHYFDRPGNSPDLAQNLGATGHIVEFLAVAATDKELRQPWVTRAVDYLCEVFEKTEKVDLECGALYHAAHGLVLYLERMHD